jgi:hypothetical protein
MSALLTAPAPVAAPPLRGDGVPPQSASRPAPAVRPESPRAPQPVESAPRGLEIRFEDSQGRPVGPPPAFKVSLLAAIREAALQPRKPAPPAAPAHAPEPAQVDRKV